MTHRITDAGFLQLLWEEDQLCQVCQERLWTQRGRWHPGRICADCAATEPEPEEDTDAQ